MLKNLFSSLFFPKCYKSSVNKKYEHHRTNFSYDMNTLKYYKTLEVGASEVYNISYENANNSPFTHAEGPI